MFPALLPQDNKDDTHPNLEADRRLDKSREEGHTPALPCNTIVQGAKGRNSSHKCVFQEAGQEEDKNGLFQPDCPFLKFHGQN
ncbi:hypothetical protein ES703_80871 [subsurface metagenome]